MSIRSYKDVKAPEYEQSEIFLSVSSELMGRVGDVREMLYGTTRLTGSDFHWLSRSWTSEQRKTSQMEKYDLKKQTKIKQKKMKKRKKKK